MKDRKMHHPVNEIAPTYGGAVLNVDLAEHFRRQAISPADPSATPLPAAVRIAAPEHFPTVQRPLVFQGDLFRPSCGRPLRWLIPRGLVAPRRVPAVRRAQAAALS